MHIVHGTWIPEATDEYVQTGGFYLWVESDTPTRQVRSHNTSVHPRHLTNEALEKFLAPIRERRAQFAADPKIVDRIIHEGSARAREEDG